MGYYFMWLLGSFSFGAASRIGAGARLLFLEFLLKGGFFVAGAILYFGDRSLFSEFVYLNSSFTLFYNAAAFGLPFLHARELHRNADFSVRRLTPLAVFCVCAVTLFMFAFSTHALVAAAAGAMIVADVVYSRYRITRGAPIFVVLSISGFIILVSNILSGLWGSVDLRYVGILISGVLLMPVLVQLLVSGWHSDVAIESRWRLIGDGASFSVTHALFWVRNGLDKIILFPLLSVDEYSRYGAVFFVLSACQTVLTSLLRILQKWIFDLAESEISRIRTVHIAIFCLAVVLLSFAALAGAGYVTILALGGFVHLFNQVIVNFLNYRRPVFVYTSANVAVSVMFGASLFLIGPSVMVISYLFCLSNVLLCLIYLLALGGTNLRTHVAAGE
ncbi:hypothetical protein K9B35_19295 [Sphingomonas sp. R647]|uniref:hypothetical protein n=1 Tax=Sphingomonas sp. R647 TaxID=2875233 RepID=UPI001CD2E2E0|nr:hypothetical protein [Sphingomonas sp. R647]MCA1200118.1 hypothetical protein [Sphingomonas sp. R647]